MAEVEIEEVTEEEKTYNLGNFSEYIEIFKNELSDEKIKLLLSQHLEKMIEDSGITGYEIVFLYDENESISTFHSNRIYQAVKDLDKKKNILMVIQSSGGQIEPAYLISKTCKRLCKKKFVISIPRRAKSAATLISLGANELHMGLLSELGPIDPQFNGFPASGLANAMEKIAEMACRFPGSSDLFAKYLTDNLDIKDLGYFERINESAAQYAERLLKGKKLPEPWSEESLSNHLTNHYKDHGFVIDSDEATSLLGKPMVKENTEEYELGNKVYEFLDFLDLAYGIFREKNISYVGGLEDGLKVFDKPEN